MLNYVATRSVSFTPKLSHRLIKFRYGASKLPSQSADTTKQAGQAAQQPQGQGAVLWDFELPARFKRKSIDDQEMAIINNGGPL